MQSPERLALFAADDKRHGKEPLWDCVDAKKFLATLPYVDPDRIGIMGGSYGGYMVAAALAFEPDVFDVGVNIFGVTNWLRTLGSIPVWWEAQRKALYAELGDPVADERRTEIPGHAPQEQTRLLKAGVRLSRRRGPRLARADRSRRGSLTCAARSRTLTECIARLHSC